MRHLYYLIAVLPCVIPVTIAINPPSYPSFNVQPNHSLRFQRPHQVPRTQRNRGLLVQWRDRVIRLLWNAGGHDPPNSASVKSSTANSGPPTSLLARFGEDVILRFSIQSEAEAAALTDAVMVLFLDVWEFTTEWVDIRLSKRLVPSLLSLLPSSLHQAHTPLIPDLAQAIFDSYPSHPLDEPSPPTPERYRTSSPDLHVPAGETNIFFRSYQPLSVIVPWMKLLTSLFPTHVRMVSIGLSYEGRDIHALRVGVHPTNSERPSAPRKTIIIAAGSHAREWISTSTVAYVAFSFITEYGKTPAVTKLVEEFDWVFIPTLNPDGYVYTWETDRLWRKNRQHTTLPFCQGVDLDRGYGYEWDDGSSSTTPCSESFSGDAPFEAVESRRLANWVRNETDHNHAKFVGFLDFHSYSQQVLYPYSYSCTSTPPSLENLEELAIGLAKAIRLTNGVKYGVTSACEGSVPVELREQSSRQRPQTRGNAWPQIETGGGSALDWFYHELRVHYSYQIKLRDTGSYGFLLPSAHIVPTGKEALSAVRYFGNFLLGNKGIEGVQNQEGLEGGEHSATEGPDERNTTDDGNGSENDKREDEDEDEEEEEEEDDDDDEYGDDDVYEDEYEDDEYEAEAEAAKRWELIRDRT